MLEVSVPGSLGRLQAPNFCAEPLALGFQGALVGFADGSPRLHRPVETWPKFFQFSSGLYLAHLLMALFSSASDARLYSSAAWAAPWAAMPTGVPAQRPAPWCRSR